MPARAIARLTRLKASSNEIHQHIARQDRSAGPRTQHSLRPLHEVGSLAGAVRPNATSRHTTVLSEPKFHEQIHGQACLAPSQWSEPRTSAPAALRKRLERLGPMLVIDNNESIEWRCLHSSAHTTSTVSSPCTPVWIMHGWSPGLPAGEAASINCSHVWRIKLLPRRVWRWVTAGCSAPPQPHLDRRSSTTKLLRALGRTPAGSTPGSCPAR